MSNYKHAGSGPPLNTIPTVRGAKLSQNLNATSTGSVSTRANQLIFRRGTRHGLMEIYQVLSGVGRGRPTPPPKPLPLKRNLSETVYFDGGRGVTISDFSRCTVTSPGLALRGLRT